MKVEYCDKCKELIVVCIPVQDHLTGAKKFYCKDCFAHILKENPRTRGNITLVKDK